MEVHMEKHERAEIINSHLENRGIKEWGRASTIVAAVGCSQATAHGWLQGSLPQDPRTMLKFCDAFEMDIRTWIDGSEPQNQPNIDAEKLMNSVVQIAEFQNATEKTLSPRQFARSVAFLYRLNESPDVLAPLAKIMTSE
jgi:hypothetical protein